MSAARSFLVASQAAHPDAPFPGLPFRLTGDGASFSSIAVAQVGARDSSTGAEAAPLPVSAPASAAPLFRYSPGDESGAVILSEASSFILHLVARHDGTTETDVLARLIAERAKEVGLSPLLGRHFEDSS